MRCSASELTAHLGGELAGPDVSIEGARMRTLGPGDAVLVKGSRVVGLEDVVRAYLEAEGACRRSIENDIRAGNTALP
jgi:UDP-N-acetylmuramyl pentapeptide synthase